MSGGFYRGTSLEQDARFSDKDKKLLQSRQWPAEFDQKVNLKKVELGVIKNWVAKKVTEILGVEDEVIINLVITELESQGANKKGICPKSISLMLQGFLNKHTTQFMMELWNLLLDAQNSKNGIPTQLIQEKKDEFENKKESIIQQQKKLENLQLLLAQQDQLKKNKLQAQQQSMYNQGSSSAIEKLPTIENVEKMFEQELSKINEQNNNDSLQNQNFKNNKNNNGDAQNKKSMSSSRSSSKSSEKKKYQKKEEEKKRKKDKSKRSLSRSRSRSRSSEKKNKRKSEKSDKNKKKQRDDSDDEDSQDSQSLSSSSSNSKSSKSSDQEDDDSDQSDD